MNEIIFSAKLPAVDDLNSPNHIVEFKITNEYPTAKEYVHVFNSFLRAIGFCDYSIFKAELDMSLNVDLNARELVESLMQESGIMEISDHMQELFSVEEKQKKEIGRLQQQIISLKAELSRLKDPENPQYTDEEMDAMCSIGSEKLWD